MVFLLALSLGVDAFAVAVSCGMTTPGFGKSHALWLGAYFGAFQLMMTALGFFTGVHFSGHAGVIGNFIACILLATLGGRMVWEAVHGGVEEVGIAKLTHGRLLVLAVATSIDALAAGVSLAFLTVDIFSACVTIGAVAFLLSAAGGLFGRRVGDTFQKWAELAGGLVLIALGIGSLF